MRGPHRAERLRIAIDAHWLAGAPRTGLGTYLRSLVSDWVARPDGPKLDLLLSAPPGPELPDYALFTHPNVRVLHPARAFDSRARYLAQLFWHQCAIPRLLLKSRPHVYFSPFHLTAQMPPGVRMVTTIHDLCFLNERCLSTGRLVHTAQLWSACLRARRLVCVSKFTLNQLSRWSAFFARKADVVHNGMDARTLPVDEARERVRGLCANLTPGRYLVWVGAPSERKNMGLLFGIFAAHARLFAEHKFVVVTPAETHEAVRAQAQAEGILGSLRLLSGLDTVGRDALYRCALAHIYPSSCEGFGYPVLEAMFQGCPSFFLSQSAMEEVQGDIVPPALAPAPQAFVSAMAGWNASSETERERIGEQLMLSARQFSSHAMASGTLDVLAKAAARK